MNITTPKNKSIIEHIKRIFLSKSKVVIGTVLFIVLATLWVNRFETIVTNDGGLGAVMFFNKWTGHVVIVNQFGSQKHVSLQDNKTKKADPRKIVFESDKDKL